MSCIAQIDFDHKGWLIVVAIGLSAVAVGAIADFLVKKDEIKWLHGKLLKLSEALTQIPLKEWQVRIARAGIEAIESLHRHVSLFVMRANMDFPPVVQIEKAKVGKEEKTRTIMRMEGIIRIRRVPSFVYGVILCLFGVVLYSVREWWWFGAFLAFIFLGLTLGSITTISYIWRTTSHVRGLYEFPGLAAFFLWSSISISAIVSTLAYMIARYFIPSNLLNSQWYDISDGTLISIHQLLLYCVNFPFDLATIIVSILLLKFVIKRGRFIGLVAAIDIVISAMLTLMLYSFLLMIENKWDILHLHVHFVESVHWVTDVIVGVYHAAKYNEPWSKHLAGLRDVHLFPTLLTTFVPVTLYMSVFMLISFSKPVLKLASRIFAVVGEKEELVFKQFGFLIGIIVAAVKAINDVLT